MDTTYEMVITTLKILHSSYDVIENRHGFKAVRISNELPYGDEANATMIFNPCGQLIDVKNVRM